MVRPNRSIVLSEYLAFYLRSSQAQGWMKDRYFGMDMPRINVEDARAVPVALPPIEEQKEIVRTLKTLETSLLAVDRSLQSATGKVRRAFDAVLEQAFMGELVPKEADLARAEGHDYESGEQLLARIARERAKEPVTNRASRTGLRQVRTP